jgi:hypothetical protein
MFVESLLAHCSTVMLILSPRPCFYAFFLLLVNNYLLSVHICSLRDCKSLSLLFVTSRGWGSSFSALSHFPYFYSLLLFS